jgi:RNA polymerase sigma factor (sigma-70 family)
MEDSVNNRTPQVELPTTEVGYRVYRRTLLSVLNRLAIRGYAVAPGDGLEIVHDFFLEVWPGLRERYDPTKGSVESYVRGAFIRFARPRIIRNAKWTANLWEPHAIALVEEPVDDEREDRLDVAFLREAFASLSPLHRDVLRQRLIVGTSEREIARRLRVSRYRVRELAAEALGHLSVKIGETGLVGARDWPLAYTLWAEERTLPDAAAKLGLTSDQARRARLRMLRALSSAVTAGSQPARRRRTPMNDLCSLWRDLVHSPKDVTLIDRVRAHLEEILDHVEHCEECLRIADEATDIVSVYAALASDELSPEDNEVLDDMLAARRDDDADVERAVTDVLLPQLGGKLHDLAAIGPDVTPIRLFLAIDAVAMLAERLLSDEREQRELVLTPEGAFMYHGRTVADSRVVIGEISHVAGVSEPTAERLATWWLPNAARQQPRLFSGLEARPLNDRSVRMTARPGYEDLDGDMDLARQWQPVSLLEQEAELEAQAQYRTV